MLEARLRSNLNNLYEAMKVLVFDTIMNLSIEMKYSEKKIVSSLILEYVVNSHMIKAYKELMSNIVATLVLLYMFCGYPFSSCSNETHIDDDIITLSGLPILKLPILIS